MTSFDDIEAAIDAPDADAHRLLASGEAVLENWLAAHEIEPTDALREGFRLLALHKQGSRDDPSFNACRETCRELAYHYNLIEAGPDDVDAPQRLIMMRFAARHLLLFVRGKLEEAGLGEFCCASRPLRDPLADRRANGPVN